MQDYKNAKMDQFKSNIEIVNAMADDILLELAEHRPQFFRLGNSDCRARAFYLVYNHKWTVAVDYSPQAVRLTGEEVLTGFEVIFSSIVVATDEGLMGHEAIALSHYPVINFIEAYVEFEQRARQSRSEFLGSDGLSTPESLEKDFGSLIGGKSEAQVGEIGEALRKLYTISPTEYSSCSEEMSREYSAHVVHTRMLLNGLRELELASLRRRLDGSIPDRSPSLPVSTDKLVLSLQKQVSLLIDGMRVITDFHMRPSDGFDVEKLADVVARAFQEHIHQGTQRSRGSESEGYGNNRNRPGHWPIY